MTISAAGLSRVNSPHCGSSTRQGPLRDPNGYVIELTASTGKHGEIMDPVISKPHEALAHWQATKSH
jgi:hypothetical protein